MRGAAAGAGAVVFGAAGAGALGAGGAGFCGGVPGRGNGCGVCANAVVAAKLNASTHNVLSTELL